MAKIELTEELGKSLLEYESDIIPNIGDIYAAIIFDDNRQREVYQRLLIPSCPDNIVIRLKLSFPYH